MTPAVVVVGPGAVTSSGVVDPDLVRTALDCVDDRLAVHDDRIVTVRELWCSIAEAALHGAHGAGVVLVVPTRWASARVELVEDAMLTVCSDVVVRRRGDVLRTFAGAVVELDVDAPWDTDGVIASLDGAAAVAIDTPAGVGELDALALELERRLDRRGIEVIRVADDDVRAAAAIPSPTSRRRTARMGVIGCAVAVSAILAGAAWRSGPAPSDTTWIVEGRVAFEAPADWTVERVTTGPGSARVQVVSPDGRAEVHVTQAAVAPRETLEGTARTLSVALGRQPDGVFEAFRPDDVVAGRAAVSYREVRSGVVDWTVVVDRGVRIAIGCRDDTAEPRRGVACERAITTARNLGGTETPPGAS